MDTRLALEKTEHWLAHRREDDDELVGFLVPAGGEYGQRFALNAPVTGDVLTMQ